MIRERLKFERKFGNHFLENDPNVERTLQFQRDINKCLAQYEQVRKDLNKSQRQILITDFITKSRQYKIVPNPSNTATESHKVLSRDASDILPIRKKRLYISYDNDNSA